MGMSHQHVNVLYDHMLHNLRSLLRVVCDFGLHGQLCPSYASASDIYQSTICRGDTSIVGAVSLHLFRDTFTAVLVGE